MTYRSTRPVDELVDELDRLRRRHQNKLVRLDRDRQARLVDDLTDQSTQSIRSIKATSDEWRTFLNTFQTIKPGEDDILEQYKNVDRKFFPVLASLALVRNDYPGLEEGVYKHIVAYVENEKIGIHNAYPDYNTCAYICEPDGKTRITGVALTAEYMSSIINDVLEQKQERFFLYAIPQTHVINEGLDTMIRNLKDPDTKQSFEEWKEHLVGEMDLIPSDEFKSAIEKFVFKNTTRTGGTQVLVHEVEPNNEHAVNDKFVSICDDAKKSGIKSGQLQMMHPCLVEGDDVTVAGTIRYGTIAGQDTVEIVVSDDSGHYMEHSGVVIDKNYLKETFQNILEDSRGKLTIQLVSDTLSAK